MKKQAMLIKEKYHFSNVEEWHLFKLLHLKFLHALFEVWQIIVYTVYQNQIFSTNNLQWKQDKLWQYNIYNILNDYFINHH